LKFLGNRLDSLEGKSALLNISWWSDYFSRG
jgi:hypothetical protein